MPELSDEQRKVVRFVVAGGTNTALMYGLYLGLLWLGLHYQIALAGDYAAGIVLGYVLNRVWTFRSHGPHRRGFSRYVLTYALVFGVNALLLALAVEALGMSEQLGQVPALALATAASYCLQRFWVFSGD